MPSVSFRAPKIPQADLTLQWAPFAVKWLWFMQHGYGRRYDRNLKEKVTHGPHYFQSHFHTQTNPDTGLLCRFRHLVAGRRGGKTLSAAWEVLFYLLHPEEFHRDVHGIEDDRPIRAWCLAKDLKVGEAALDAFREAIRSAGLVHRQDYEENKAELRFEFSNGSRIRFRTAVDPQSLRGPGLDILWIDEAAFIPARDAYDVISPALDDMEGVVICTTTPDGKNWYYEEFWSDEAKEDPEIGRVEYRSIDNPHFPRRAWEYRKRTYHPLLFKQEFEASFDSMSGKELPGDWLTKHFYTNEDLPTKEVDGRKKIDLNLWLGVDPAISLAQDADHFAMALIGVTQHNEEVFLLETLKTRIPFAEQVDVISEWHRKWRPHLIGIENTAYQAALAQAVMQRSNLPPVAPMPAKGRKFERILAMSQLFRIGKVRVKAEHRDFIEEWLNYDSSLRNPKDDLLDAVEISLRTAGALLPLPADPRLLQSDEPISDLERLRRKDINQRKAPQYDEHLGLEW